MKVVKSTDRSGMTGTLSSVIRRSDGVLAAAAWAPVRGEHGGRQRARRQSVQVIEGWPGYVHQPRGGRMQRLVLNQEDAVHGLEQHVQGEQRVVVLHNDLTGLVGPHTVRQHTGMGVLVPEAHKQGRRMRSR